MQPMPVMEHLPLLGLVSQAGVVEVDRGPELDQIRMGHSYGGLSPSPKCLLTQSTFFSEFS